MRLLIASDIHLEHSGPLPELPPEDSYDVVLLAGDIGNGTDAIVWAEKFFPISKPVYYVPGNHEFYSHSYELLKYKMQKLSSISRVEVLAPGTAQLGDKFKLIGATLWSDLELSGYPELTDRRVEMSIADFRWIRYNDDVFSADNCRALFERESKFIAEECVLAQSQGLLPIVMTHFVPTQMAIATQFLGDSLSPYFVNDCDGMMDSLNIPVWIFGHSHVRMDFIHPSSTRVISNAFGYPGELDDPVWKIIDLEYLNGR